jgi:hypothetical protein
MFFTLSLEIKSENSYNDPLMFFLSLDRFGLLVGWSIGSNEKREMQDTRE